MPPPLKHAVHKKAKPVRAEPPPPTTFAECLEEAISLEDKGDRYNSGPKALRFYQRACDMYSRAHNLNSEDLDVLYNWGRVLLVLAEFSDPEFPLQEKKKLYEQAEEKLRRASDNAEGGNGADCLFNLAQALTGIAEVEMALDSINFGLAIEIWKEIDEVLEKVYALQIKEWESSSGPKTIANRATDADVQQKGPAGNIQLEAASEDDNGKATIESKDEYETVTEVEPITPSSLIDTLTTHAQILSRLYSGIRDADDLTTKYYERAISKLESAQAHFDSSASMLDDREKKQLGADIKIRWADVFASRADVALERDRRVDTESFEAAIQKLDEIIAVNARDVRALCEKGDALVAWADAVKSTNGGLDRIVSAAASTEASSSSSSSPETDPLFTVRSLYARATDAFTLAYTLIPSVTISTVLGDTNLIRIRLYPDPPQQRTLASNAEKYYRRAVTLMKETGETEDVVPVLWKLAVALSWVGKEEDCKKVMHLWKKRGGTSILMADDDLGIEVGFAEVVKEWKWFNLILIKT